MSSNYPFLIFENNQQPRQTSNPKRVEAFIQLDSATEAVMVEQILLFSSNHILIDRCINGTHNRQLLQDNRSIALTTDRAQLKITLIDARLKYLDKNPTEPSKLPLQLYFIMGDDSNDKVAEECFKKINNLDCLLHLNDYIIQYNKFNRPKFYPRINALRNRIKELNPNISDQELCPLNSGNQIEVDEIKKQIKQLREEGNKLSLDENTLQSIMHIFGLQCHSKYVINQALTKVSNAILLKCNDDSNTIFKVELSARLCKDNNQCQSFYLMALICKQASLNISKLCLEPINDHNFLVALKKWGELNAKLDSKFKMVNHYIEQRLSKLQQNNPILTTAPVVPIHQDTFTTLFKNPIIPVFIRATKDTPITLDSILDDQENPEKSSVIMPTNHFSKNIGIFKSVKRKADDNNPIPFKKPKF